MTYLSHRFPSLTLSVLTAVISTNSNSARTRSALLPALRALVLLASAAAMAAPPLHAADTASLKAAVCDGNATTTISGTVYAPNGKDPIPNVLVYIPTAPLAAFPAQVSCGQEAALVSGKPMVSTYTAADGTFTLAHVPAGEKIPLVIQAGRWRRQVTIPSVAACEANSFSTRFPRNHTEGDIPRIALVTGAADNVECVLRKTGIDDAEFTNPGGQGRINLFTGDGAGSNASAGGARLDASTPAESGLVSNPRMLDAYDMIMLPCQGAEYIQSPGDMAQLFAFANAGGRVFATHLSDAWLTQNGDFAGAPDSTASKDEEVAAADKPTIDTSFDGGSEMPQALLNNVDPATDGAALLTSFNTPVEAAPGAQCGRVMFSEYHAENSDGRSDKAFPEECKPGAMTQQEKVLEYSLFDLTNFVKPAAQSTVKPAIIPTKATVTLTASSTKWDYPGSTNLTACVSIANGSAPQGEVTFYQGATPLHTIFLSGGGGCVYWYIPFYLNVGLHNITAVYNDAHNVNVSSPVLTIEVNRGHVTMEVSCWNYQFNYGPDYQCAFNMDSGTTSGYITYSYDGGPPVALWLNSWGGVVFSIKRPNAGYHGVVITYPQQGNWNAFTLPTQHFWVDPTPVQVSITPNTWYALVGTKFSFHVVVTASSAPPPDHVGTVYITDGPTLLATLTVNAAGELTYDAGALSVGTHVITANYIGTGNYANGWASATVSVGK